MKKYMLKNPIMKSAGMVLIMLLFSFASIYAQETPKLNLTIKLTIKDADLKNSMITITRKSGPFKVLDPGSGEDNVELPLGFEYLISFSKMGYAAKSVTVDTHVPEKRENGSFAKQMLMIELEKQGSASSPVNNIAYSMSKGDFDFVKKDAKVVKTQKVETPVTPVKTTDPVPRVTQKDPVKDPVQSKKPGVRVKDKKVIQEDNKKITIVTVSIDDKDHIYRKEEYNWGTYYYKNGVNVTPETYKKETE